MEKEKVPWQPGGDKGERHPSPASQLNDYNFRETRFHPLHHESRLLSSRRDLASVSTIFTLESRPTRPPPPIFLLELYTLSHLRQLCPPVDHSRFHLPFNYHVRTSITLEPEGDKRSLEPPLLALRNFSGVTSVPTRTCPGPDHAYLDCNVTLKMLIRDMAYREVPCVTFRQSLRALH